MTWHPREISIALSVQTQDSEKFGGLEQFPCSGGLGFVCLAGCFTPSVKWVPGTLSPRLCWERGSLCFDFPRLYERRSSFLY